MDALKQRTVLAALLLLWYLPVGAEAGAETAGYVALPEGVLAVSCPVDSRTILDGFGHEPPGWNPLENPDGWLGIYDWECTAADAQNEAREQLGADPQGFGYGAYPFVFEDMDAGTPAAAAAEDALIGSRPSLVLHVDTLDGVGASTEGCGTQAMILPDDPEPHRYWGDLRLWVWVRPLHVEDDLGLCIGTTGQLHATWGTS